MKVYHISQEKCTDSGNWWIANNILKSMFKHIVKLLKIKDKSPKSIREKQCISSKSHLLMTAVSSANIEARGIRTTDIWKKITVLKILYPVKTSYRNECERYFLHQSMSICHQQIRGGWKKNKCPMKFFRQKRN